MLPRFILCSAHLRLHILEDLLLVEAPARECQACKRGAILVLRYVHAKADVRNLLFSHSCRLNAVAADRCLILLLYSGVTGRCCTESRYAGASAKCMLAGNRGNISAGEVPLAAAAERRQPRNECLADVLVGIDTVRQIHLITPVLLCICGRDCSRFEEEQRTWLRK